MNMQKMQFLHNTFTNSATSLHAAYESASSYLVTILTNMHKLCIKRNACPDTKPDHTSLFLCVIVY